MENKISVGIIGYGRVGKSLSEAFNSLGILSFILTYSREKTPGIKSKHHETIKVYHNVNEIEHCPDFIFLTIPDKTIESVSEVVAGHFQDRIENKYICHTSGINSIDVLSSCEKYGAKTASVHPYQTFYYPSSSILMDIPWGIYTDYYGEISGLIKLIKGKPFNLKELPGYDKALYHASAVAASNYLNSVITLAGMLAEKAGISAIDFLPKIIQATVDNNFKSLNDGTCLPLTGPISRGDINALKLHIESLKNDKSLLKSYCYEGLSLAESAYKFNLLKQAEYDEIVNLFSDSINIF